MLTTNDKKQILEIIDWMVVHKYMVLYDFGTQIVFFPNGFFEVYGSSISVPSNSIATLTVTGMSNIDTEYYTEDMDTKDLTLKECVIKCIKNGDHSKIYDMWEKEIICQWEEKEEDELLYNY